jgi:hypothetical protein
MVSRGGHTEYRIIAFGTVQRCEHIRDLFGHVLKIVVDRDEDLAARRPKPGQRGFTLPHIARKPNGSDARIGSRNLGQERPARVDAAIIDKNELEAPSKRLHDGDQARVKPRQDRRRIVNRNDDRVLDRCGRAR